MENIDTLVGFDVEVKGTLETLDSVIYAMNEHGLNFALIHDDDQLTLRLNSDDFFRAVAEGSIAVTYVSED